MGFFGGIPPDSAIVGETTLRDKHRDWNFAAVVVGLPGVGKTTLQVQLIRRHLQTPTGIVLAHDPMAQFTRHGCHFYKDANAWRAAAAKAAKSKTPMPRGASIGGYDSDGITTLALEIGELCNRAERITVPILVPYDEGSLREGSSSSHITPLDNRLLAVRRHAGVGPVFNLQECKQLTARFYRVATDVFLFRQTAERARELDSLLFLERGTLEAAGVTQLENHRYLHVKVGQGIVREPL
jgi:hypothetical protein